MTIKNVYINSKETISNFETVYNIGKEVLNIQNCIFELGDNKLYYGSNFFGFYFSWKLGKIGLVALDGRGVFQGSIDEEWLLNKGFEKKTK